MTSLIELGGIKDAILEAILDALENPDPENPEQEVILQSQLAELELEIASKVDAIAGVFAAKQAEINYLVERREHFDKLAKSRQNAIDRLKAYVKLALERQGATSIAGKEASRLERKFRDYFKPQVLCPYKSTERAWPSCG